MISNQKYSILVHQNIFVVQFKVSIFTEYSLHILLIFLNKVSGSTHEIQIKNKGIAWYLGQRNGLSILIL